MAHYRDLTVWQKSMDVVTTLYRFTSKLPGPENFGLVSQMRRCAVSIPSNIAEGSRRRGKDLRHFLLIAYGSGSELETQLEICRRLEYGNAQELQKIKALLDEVMRMLNKMVNG
jgi:four helix bundle protein